MKIYEIGTGYTSIPAKVSAATEIVVEQVTRALQNQDIAVEIIDIFDPDRMKSDLPIREVKVPRMLVDADVRLGVIHKLKRVVYSIALAKELKHTLKNMKNETVLHFHNQYNMFFFLLFVPQWLRKKCVTCYTNHSGIWRLEWGKIRSVIRKRYFQEAYCMKKADVIFVLNEETKDNVVQHLKVEPQKIKLIGNGVNVDVYTILPVEKIEEIKKNYHLSGKHIILQIGSICENKGQLRALQLLLPKFRENKDIVYVYAGGIVSDQYQEQINTFVKSNGIEERVFYLGMIKPGKELNGIYNVADALIMPSRYEGFPLVILEAMSAGVPVLLHEDRPFLDSEGSIYYNESNFENILQMLLDNAEDRNGRMKIRKKIAENYSWDKIVKDYIEGWSGGGISSKLLFLESHYVAAESACRVEAVA